jgi:hypothetical protein
MSPLTSISASRIEQLPGQIRKEKGIGIAMSNLKDVHRLPDALEIEIERLTRTEF